MTAQQPRIVCLCGPARFTAAYADAIRAGALAGDIVVYTPDLRAELDAMPAVQREEALTRIRAHHLRLIDLCDVLKVLNVGGYTGENTRDEIAYGHLRGKEIVFLEPVPPENVGVFARTQQDELDLDDAGGPF